MWRRNDLLVVFMVIEEIRDVEGHCFGQNAFRDLSSSHFVETVSFSHKPANRGCNSIHMSKCRRMHQQYKSPRSLGILADKVHRVFLSYLLRKLKLQFVVKSGHCQNR